VSKGTSKRGYHKQDMQKANRTALIIGGTVAAAILLIITFSFVA
jgi:hypothetical protein